MKLSEKRKFLHVMWKDFCELWSPDGDKSGEFTNYNRGWGKQSVTQQGTKFEKTARARVR